MVIIIIEITFGLLRKQTTEEVGVLEVEVERGPGVQEPDEDSSGQTADCRTIVSSDRSK